jgi:hypothetical protein
MTIPTNPQNDFTPFLPTTVNFPEEEERLKTFLVDNLASYADVINDKKIGVYVEENSVLNGNKHWYANTRITRNGYQSFVFINGLPNAGVLIIDANSDPAFPIDNIQPEFLMWHMWGTASKPPSAFNAGDADFFSFSNRGDPRITFDMTDLVLTITTTVDLSAYFCFIVFEFIRAGTNGI